MRVDASGPAAIDAAAELKTIPNWTLEDIQTDSAMLGQTYGLDTFAGCVIPAKFAKNLRL